MQSFGCYEGYMSASFVQNFGTDDHHVIPIIAMDVVSDDRGELGYRIWRKKKADLRRFSVLRVLVVEKNVVLS